MIDKAIFIITWNLRNNEEVRNLKIRCDQISPKKIYFTRSLSAGLNSFIPRDSNSFYNLNYCFELGYLNGSKAYNESTPIKAQNDFTGSFLSDKNSFAATNKLISDGFCEIKAHPNILLGISQSQIGTLQLSYKVINLQYLKYLLEAEENGIIPQQHELLLPLVNFKLLNGDTFMHVFSLNQSILESFLNTIKKKKSQDHLHLIFLILTQNSNGKSALKRVIKSKEQRSLEIMIDILSLGKPFQIDLLQYMKHEGYSIFEMKTQQMIRFLDRFGCQQVMKVNTEWPFSEQHKLFSSQSSYISDKHVKQNLKMSQLKLEEMLQKRTDTEKKRSSTFYGGYQTLLDIKESKNVEVLLDTPQIFYQNEKSNNGQNIVRPIEFYAYDIGWLVRDQPGAQFIQYLSHLEKSSTIFESKFIQTLIDYQWYKFKTKFIMKYFIFIVLFFGIMIFQTTINHDISEAYPLNKGLKIFRLVLTCCILTLSFFFMIVEATKLYNSRSKVNAIQMAFYIFVQVISVLILAGVNNNESFQTYFFVLTAILCICSYIWFFVQLRVFGQFATLISMVYYVLQGSLYFMLIMIFIIFACANTFYILDTALETTSSHKDRFFGKDYFYTFVFTYLASIGDIRDEKIDDIIKYKDDFKYQFLTYVTFTFLLISTFALTVVMLNLFVALMSDLYSQIVAGSSTERYKAKAQFIKENEFLVKRSQLFKNTKYIIRVEASQQNQAQVPRNFNLGMINTITEKVRMNQTVIQANTDIRLDEIEQQIKQMKIQNENQDATNNAQLQEYNEKLMASLTKIIQETLSQKH